MVREQLASRGIRDGAVLAAMGIVPREAFVPAGEVERSYDDGALSIGHGQTISQPYMVARMTESLALDGPWRPPAEPPTVLDVGTGSGYQAAVLAQMGARVVSIERDPGLADEARGSIGDPGLRRGGPDGGWQPRLRTPCSVCRHHRGRRRTDRPLGARRAAGGRRPTGRAGRHSLQPAPHGRAASVAAGVETRRARPVSSSRSWEARVTPDERVGRSRRADAILARVTHVFVAPHPDDAALSCGGLIASLRELGQSVAIVTVYSGGPSSGPELSDYQREALGFGTKALWPNSQAFNRSNIASEYPVSRRRQFGRALGGGSRSHRGHPGPGQHAGPPVLAARRLDPQRERHERPA